MTTIFDEETEEESDARYAAETAGIKGRLEPQGVTIPPEQQEQAEDSMPLESLITVDLCGLLFLSPIRFEQSRRGMTGGD